MVQPSRSRAFFNSLESLRGLAALLVLLYHLPPWFGPVYEPHLVRNGYLMVDFFFVLSGFVIYLSYGEQLNRPNQMMRFATLRLVRLYPVHFLFVMIFLLIEALKLVAQHHGIHSATALAFQDNNIAEFMRHLVLVQGLGLWGAVPGSTFNGPSWSISTEFYTYLVFALCMRVAGRKWLKYWAIGIALSSSVALIFTIADPVSYPLRCLLGFFAGCLVFELYSKHGPLSRRTSTWLVYGVAIIIGAFLWMKPDGKAHGLIDLAIVPLSVVLVFATLGSKVPVLETAPLRWLGRVSYSLYMSHLLCIWLMSQALRFVFKFPYENSVYRYGAFPVLSLRAALLAYPATLLLCLIVAAFTYRFIEEPSHRYVKVLRERWQARQKRSAASIG